MDSQDQRVAIALSILDDVEEERKSSRWPDEEFQRDAAVKAAFRDDFRAARRKINEAQRDGVDVTHALARLLYEEGRAECIVALGPGSNWKLHFSARRAVKLLEKSLQHEDTPQVRYALGMACKRLLGPTGRSKALHNLRIAERQGDEETRLEAGKEIARVESRSMLNCYIATACYGSHCHPDVVFLRDYRDRILMSSQLGRIFVSLYYATAPPIAAALRHLPTLAAMIRNTVLSPIVRGLKKRP